MQIELKTYTRPDNAARAAKRAGHVSFDVRPMNDGKYLLKHRANGDGPVNLIWAYCVKHLGGEIGNSRESLIIAAKQVKADLIADGFKVNTVKTQVSRFCVTRGNKADWLAYEKSHRDGLMIDAGLTPVDAKRFIGRKVKHNTSKV